MKVIVILGENDTGKTTVLKKLVEILLDSGARHKCAPTELHNPDGDEDYMLSYKGYDIVICTIGDFRKGLEQNCDKHYNNCDMFIGAARASFVSTNEVVCKYDNIGTMVLLRKEDFYETYHTKVSSYLKELIDLRLNGI
jgi:CO dehydrogenase nickel-insertion accessory protein CooC1